MPSGATYTDTGRSSPTSSTEGISAWTASCDCENWSLSEGVNAPATKRLIVGTSPACAAAAGVSAAALVEKEPMGTLRRTVIFCFGWYQNPEALPISECCIVHDVSLLERGRALIIKMSQLLFSHLAYL